MQSIIITAFFTNNGIPIDTLSPTIRIRKAIDGSLIITDASMYFVGDGQYAYNFGSLEVGVLCTVVCDGGGTLADGERYSYTSCETPPIELVADFDY